MCQRIGFEVTTVHTFNTFSWLVQVIMEKRRRGDRDFIAHSLDLFIDFVQVFRRILVILMQKVRGFLKHVRETFFADCLLLTFNAGSEGEEGNKKLKIRRVLSL